VATFSTFVDSIVRDGNDGKQFERFVKWFLIHDPVWSTQVSKVWLWKDYPDRWHDDDQGIDLVVLDKSETTWAVQAKCYAPEYAIPRKDVDSFLTESNRKQINRRLLIASTDLLGRNTRRVIEGQEKPVTVFLRSDFERARLSYPTSYKDLRSVKKVVKPSPYPYQKDAISSVIKGLKNTDRGQLIMASGTGKTLVSLWINERIKAKNTLVLVPSLALLSQVVQEWTSVANKSFKVLCVCSDKSVGERRESDQFVASADELPFPVHSDKKIISKFLWDDQDRVLFATYQSTPILVDIFRSRKTPSFDLVIADEAHRCAGIGGSDSPFSNILYTKCIRADKRLFTTATPRTYSTLVTKAAESRGVEIVGMDDETLFGKPLYTLSFGEAISSNPPLLTDYRVLIVGVESSMIKNLISKREFLHLQEAGITTDAETLATQVAVIKAVVSNKLRRVISFHNRISRARKFSESLEVVSDIVGKHIKHSQNLSSDYVSGKMSTSDRNRKLADLKNADKVRPKVLANARCLQEGVDIPTLDGIVFVDPRNSPIDITQAVGRAIRLDKDKKIGLVVIPIFVEAGEDASEVADKSSFKKVWGVLNGLKSHDDVLATELNELRVRLGNRQRGSTSRLSFSKIAFDMPEGFQKQFIEELKIILVESTTASWYFWFGLLQTYVDEHGHTLVPITYETPEGYKLGQWVGSQRSLEGVISEERRQQLDTLGFVWDVLSYQWNVGFGYLRAYIDEHGDSLVPIRYKTLDGYMLGGWIQSQRKSKDSLSKEQQKNLDGLGFIWDPFEDQWNVGFEYLQAYVEEHGDALVPATYKTPDGYGLGSWVRSQRYYSPEKNQEHRRKLDTLGFVWDTYQDQWDQGFQYLQAYVEQHGDTLIPNSYMAPDGYSLGQWARIQREDRNVLDQERRKKLDALGFVWEVLTHQWNVGFEYLQAYVEEHGDALVPTTYKTPDGYGLGSWVSNKRSTKDQISKERLEQLDTLGFVWDVLSYQWNVGFGYLRAYIDEHGDSLVPKRYKTLDGYMLGGWIQRQKKSKDSLSKERRRKLEALGVVLR